MNRNLLFALVLSLVLVVGLSVALVIVVKDRPETAAPSQSVVNGDTSCGAFNSESTAPPVTGPDQRLRRIFLAICAPGSSSRALWIDNIGIIDIYNFVNEFCDNRASYAAPAEWYQRNRDLRVDIPRHDYGSFVGALQRELAAAGNPQCS